MSRARNSGMWLFAALRRGTCVGPLVALQPRDRGAKWLCLGLEWFGLSRSSGPPTTLTGATLFSNRALQPKVAATWPQALSPRFCTGTSDFLYATPPGNCRRTRRPPFVSCSQDGFHPVPFLLPPL